MAAPTWAQDTDQAAKPAAKKAVSGKQPAAAPPKPRSWTEDELGGTKAGYAEITTAPTGKPILAIHFPWRAYARPSVEVRWMADDESDTAELRPLGFVADVMKGEITSALYAARESAWDTPTKKKFKDHDREFEILGARNLLGRPAATVLYPALAKGKIWHPEI